MIGIVVVSLGDLSCALLPAAIMILGEQTQIVAVSFTPGMTPESPRESLIKAIDSVDDGDGVLLLADLLGGTPARIICEEVIARQLPALSGVNLPMPLEICVQRDMVPLDQLREIVYNGGHAGIIDIAECLKTME